MEALLKYLAQKAPELMEGAGKFAAAHRTPLAAAAGLGAAGLAAHELKPKLDDFMTDQALKSVGRKVKQGAADTIDFGQKHPYALASLMGGSGLAGAALGPENFSNVFDTVSPVKTGALSDYIAKKRGQR